MSKTWRRKKIQHYGFSVISVQDESANVSHLIQIKILVKKREQSQSFRAEEIVLTVMTPAKPVASFS